MKAKMERWELETQEIRRGIKQRMERNATYELDIEGPKEQQMEWSKSLKDMTTVLE